MMNVVEGFTMNVIWPFLPFMVEAFGVATEDTVGLYVGILGKLFARTNPLHQDRMVLGSLHSCAWLQVPATILLRLAVLLSGAS